MDKIKTIRQEIERRQKELDDHNYYLDSTEAASGYELALYDLLSFIDSLPEESCKDSLQVPETCKENQDSFTSLEEAAWDCILDSIDVNNPVLLPKYKELLLYLFKAGAEWQKEQMMKEAVDGEVVKDISNKLAVTAKITLDGFKFGDKVKIIIVKEDD